jgi:peptidyl-prolyl cis-trans isomerase SurA
MLVRFVVRIALAAVLLVPALADAQVVDRIAAVVNDEVITVQDVEYRLRMAIALSNLQDTTENRKRALPQVLRKMIDERLQLQEGNRLKITMTPAEVDAGIATIEEQNRQPRGSLIKRLAQAGVPAHAIREQIRADFTWIRVAQRTLKPTIRIGEEELKDRLEAINARTGQPEYLVAEIYLPIENPAQEDEMSGLAQRLVEQLRGGASFPTLAAQFSRSPTAANGGQMGWVARGMLDDELIEALERLQSGQLSGPVRAADGIHIMLLVNRRIAGSAIDRDASVVTLGRIILPVPKDGPPKDQLLARANELTRGAKNCDELLAIGRKLAAPTVGQLPPTRIGELHAELRAIATSLPVNRVAPPVDTADGVLVAMVCHREESTTVQAPTPEQVRRAIEDERMDMLTRRYLRDLRRAAFIDVRM